MARFLFTVGALMGFIAVAAGAMGAHALKDKLDAYHLGVFEIGVRYQMYHALAIMAAAWINSQNLAGAKFAEIAGLLFIIGVATFSLPLYILAIADMKWMGAIAPLGGTSLMIAWILLAVAGWKTLPAKAPAQ